MKTEFKNIGTWGTLHYDFLYRNQRSVINAMRLKGTLHDYLMGIRRLLGCTLIPQSCFAASANVIWSVKAEQAKPLMCIGITNVQVSRITRAATKNRSRRNGSKTL